MLRRWTALEVARGDHSLCGFWPLADHIQDRSGRGRHFFGQDSDGFLWSTWSTIWSESDEPTWEGGGISGLSPGLVQHLGRIGFWTKDGERFLATRHNPVVDASESDNFTISFWFVNADPTGPTNHGIVSQMEITPAGNNRKGWEFVTGFGGVAFNLINDANASDLVELTGDTPPGWSHVVLTKQGSSLRLFINGRLADSDTYAESPSTPNARLLVGASRFPGLPPESFRVGDIYVGLLRNYNRCLSDNDVHRLYRRELHCFDWRPKAFGLSPPSIPLFLQVHDVFDESLTLMVKGEFQESGNCNLLLENHEDVTEGLDLFLKGFPSLGQAKTLYTKGSLYDEAFKGLDLSISGVLGDLSDGLPLYMKVPTSGQPSAGFPLYLENKSGLASSMPLWIRGPFGASQATTLYTCASIGGGPVTDSVNLFLLPQTDYKPNRAMPLFMYGQGLSSADLSIPLFLNAICPTDVLWENLDEYWENLTTQNWEDLGEGCASYSINLARLGTPLFMKVDNPQRGQILYMRVAEGDGITLVCGPPTKSHSEAGPDLVIPRGHLFARDGMGLLTTGEAGYLSGTQRLTVFGANAPSTYLIGGTDLVLTGEAGLIQAGIPLIVPVSTTGTSLLNMPLFVRGKFDSLTGVAHLFVRNTDAGIRTTDFTPLYLEGPPKVNFSSYMFTYLHVAKGGSTTLFLLGEPETHSEGLPFSVRGVIPVSGSTPLSMPAVYSILRTALDEGTLYTHGF